MRKKRQRSYENCRYFHMNAYRFVKFDTQADKKNLGTQMAHRGSRNGTGNRGRTCTVAHQILNLARLPIPPYPRELKKYIRFLLFCQGESVCFIASLA